MARLRRPRFRSVLVAAIAASLWFLGLPAPAVQAAVSDWPTYHRDNFRDGFDPNAAAFTNVIPRWTSVPLGGRIYAEPLVVGNLVIVADEGDVITALNAGTGDIVWQQKVGNPVNRTNPPFPCGNINPMGITGTPVVDPVAGIVYALPFEQPANYYLVGLDRLTGAARFPQVAIAPAGFDPHFQQQRTALTIANGRVYARFGGYAGDCGNYHGWVVGVPASGSGAQVIFQDQASVPPAQNPNEAAIWATAGASVDGSGNLYVTSGNGSSTNSSEYDFGNTVFKLSPTLTLLDYWAPSGWASLNASDTDLGSVGPALVGSGNGVVFQTGKSGWGYLLNAVTLSAGGHIGNEPFSAKVCNAATNQTVGRNQVYGGVAYADPYIYVPCPEGIKALLLGAGPSFTVAWTSNPAFQAGPPIVAGGIVWAVDTNLGTLYGLDDTTGTATFGPIFIGLMTHFTTPAYGFGRIYVPSDDQVFAFGQTQLEKGIAVPQSTGLPHASAPPPVPQSVSSGRPLRPAASIASPLAGEGQSGGLFPSSLAEEGQGGGSIAGMARSFRQLVSGILQLFG